MKFNHDLLERKIKAAGETHSSLARYLGMSKTNMSSIWADRTGWQMKHVAPLAVFLKLSQEDVWDIFFAQDFAFWHSVQFSPADQKENKKNKSSEG